MSWRRARVRVPDFTLADLLAHVRRDAPGDGDCDGGGGEFGDACLVWTGYAQQGRWPQWVVMGCKMPVRRMVYLAVHGWIKPGQQIGVTCGCELCVHPDHLVSRGKKKAALGQPLGPLHRLRSTRARRAKAKITPEIASAIRASDEPSVVLAQRYGIPRQHVWRIRAGRAWVDVASHWAGLA